MEITRNFILNLQIENESDIGICRRKTVSAAKQIGFDNVKNGEIAIIITELVTNVLKHSGGVGQIIVCEINDEEKRKGIEIWCCDKGKGINNLNKALSDGYTDKGTLGIGLGSILRFSDELEINPSIIASENDTLLSKLELYSNCIRSVKWVPSKQWLGFNRRIIVGAASRSKPGEKLNGDSYIVNNISSDQSIVAVIDGLGHGKNAHLASQLVKEQILLNSSTQLKYLLESIHRSVRGTRGAVIGIALIDTAKNKIVFSGIGNIEGFILNKNEKKNLLSFGGILGHNIRTPRLFEFEFNIDDTLFLYSDGITSRWNHQDIELKNHPQQIAEFIMNNYSRQNDDATILIIRRNK